MNEFFDKHNGAFNVFKKTGALSLKYFAIALVTFFFSISNSAG